MLFGIFVRSVEDGLEPSQTYDEVNKLLQRYAMQYLQVKFNKRFDGAVSVTVLLKQSENKVEGSSPSKTFFFIFSISQRSQKFLAIYMFAEKMLWCTCKTISISKMARLVWRYSDDAGAIIENVYKLCVEEKKSGKKLSLNRVWDRTAAFSSVSRSTTQKIVQEKKKKNAQDEQQKPKEPPSPTPKVSLDYFDQGIVRRTIASMYTLKKVLTTLDNIRTELKQSIGYTGSKGRLRKDLLHTKSAYTGYGVNQKVLMARQGVVLSRIRYLRTVRELREAGYKVVYTDETYVHTSHAVPKCRQDSTTGLKIPFII